MAGRYNGHLDPSDAVRVARHVATTQPITVSDFLDKIEPELRKLGGPRQLLLTDNPTQEEREQQRINEIVYAATRHGDSGRREEKGYKTEEIIATHEWWDLSNDTLHIDYEITVFKDKPRCESLGASVTKGSDKHVIDASRVQGAKWQAQAV